MDELQHLFTYQLTSWRALTAVVSVTAVFAFGGNEQKDLGAFLASVGLGMRGTYGFGLLIANMGSGRRVCIPGRGSDGYGKLQE